MGGAPAARCFLPDRKILVLAGVVAFSGLEFAGGCTARAGFNRDLRRAQSLVTRNLSPPSFFGMMG